MRTMTRMTTAAGVGLALLLGTAGIASAQETCGGQVLASDQRCLGGNTVTISQTPENTILGAVGVIQGESVAGSA